MSYTIKAQRTDDTTTAQHHDLTDLESRDYRSLGGAERAARKALRLGASEVSIGSGISVVLVVDSGGSRAP